MSFRNTEEFTLKDLKKVDHPHPGFGRIVAEREALGWHFIHFTFASKDARLLGYLSIGTSEFVSDYYFWFKHERHSRVVRNAGLNITGLMNRMVRSGQLDREEVKIVNLEEARERLR